MSIFGKTFKNERQKVNIFDRGKNFDKNFDVLHLILSSS